MSKADSCFPKLADGHAVSLIAEMLADKNLALET
jgi:hypothetical protein